MDQIIIHVDMDAFFASVEIRDNPALRGKPLIIGSLPQERGVVSTCSYEARKFGIHSAMNIKEAYRLCPQGIYMHGQYEKYRAVSNRLHEIWNEYADASEYVALDEAYLDVTESAGSWEKACEIARVIKRRTKEELRLTCSVGVAYSKTAAKAASEARMTLLPAADNFTDSGADLVVYEEGKVYVEDCYVADNGEGMVVTVKSNSYGGMLTAMVGIDKDGAVTGVQVTEHADTPGVGTKAHAEGHLAQYVGLTELTSDQVKNDSSVQNVTGASVSSGAVHKAVYCALEQYKAMGGVK